MVYPIKTLSQLPLLLKGFRKEKGLTQAAMAARLGIAQQSYAHFEANPATATLERLYTVLRFLDVEISLNQDDTHDIKVEPTPTHKAPSAIVIPVSQASETSQAMSISVVKHKKERW